LIAKLPQGEGRDRLAECHDIIRLQPIISSETSTNAWIVVLGATGYAREVVGAWYRADSVPEKLPIFDTLLDLGRDHELQGRGNTPHEVEVLYGEELQSYGSGDGMDEFARYWRDRGYPPPPRGTGWRA